MRATIWFFCRFGLIPFVAWFLVGPGLFVLWMAVEMTIGFWVRITTWERFGLSNGISAAARADRAGAAAGQSEVQDPVASPVAQLVSELGWSVVPQSAVVESVPGHENAVMTRRRDGRPLILVSMRLASEQPPEVVRAVLAHELGHLLKVNRFGQAIAGWMDLWVPIIGMALGWAFSQSIWGPALWAAIRVTAELLRLAILRNCETRADRLAVRVGAGRDQVRYLEWSASIRKLRRTPPEWLSTHPTAKNRIARINRLASPVTAA
jgi:Zn-dependent protease with chaperone function